MSILATIEVNDLGSPVIDKFVDALSRIGGEVSRTQTQINDANTGGTTSTRQYSDALTGMVAAARAAATEQATIAAAAGQNVSAIVGLLNSLAQVKAEYQTGAQMIQLYAGGLSALALAFQENKVATTEQAAALAELAKVAQAGNGFTTEQARVLGELNAKMQAGVQMTAAESAALRKLSEDYAVANREALGLGTAMQMLLQKEQQTSSATAQHGQVLQLLTTQLTAGVQATLLQKEAFTELAAGLQASQRLTDAERVALTGLGEALQTAGSLTKLQAAELAVLNITFQTSGQTIQAYGAMLTTVASALQAGKVATTEQAAALQVLALAAQVGNGFTAEQARLLTDLNAKIAAGLPLTKAEADAILQLSEDYKVANREALGLGTAIQMLLQKEQQATAAAAQHGQAFQVLATQLQGGVKATLLQKDALAELSAGIVANKKFTEEDKAALQALSDTLTKNGSLTKQQAKDLTDLNAAYQASISTVNTAKSSFEAFQASTAVIAATLAVLAGSLYAFLKGAAELAARIETLGVVINITAKNTHQSSTEMLIQVEAVKKLGITTQEATDAVLKFTQANLRLTDASKLARAAQDLAVIAGENSSQTFSRLIQAIQTQQLELLRAVGITTTIAQVQAKYSAEIGKTIKELTQNEKQQAVLNFILQEASKATGAYEAAMNTAGKQLTSFARYTEEARRVLGEGLVPTMGLVIVSLTELLKYWIALPAPIHAAVAALLAAAAAAALFSAALAGAQFLGWIGLLVSLVEKVKYFVIGLEAGMPVLVALVSAFGGWTLAIAAVVAVIALAAAGWVWFSSTQGEATLEIQKATAAAIEQREAFAKVGDEAKRIEANMAALKAKGIEPSRLALDEYRDIAEKLLKIAPQMVEVLNAETRQYRILTDEINKTTAAKKAEVEQDLDKLRVRVFATRGAVEAAEQELRDAQDKLGKLQRAGGTAGGYDPMGGQFGTVAGTNVIAKAAADVAELTDKVKQLKPAAAEAFAALKDAFTRSDKVQQHTKDMTEANKVLTAYTHSLELAKEKGDTFDIRMKVAGKSTLDLVKAVEKGPREVAALLDALDKTWAEYEKKRAAEAKKAAAQYKSAYENFTGDNKAQLQQFKALDQALKDTAGNQEAYQSVIEAGAGTFKKYNALTAEHRAALKLTALDTAAAAGEFDKFAKVLSTWMSKVNESIGATERLSDTIVHKLSQAFADDAVGASVKLREMSRAANEDIEKDTRDLYERLVVAKMTEVDQQIYQEQRRIAEIIKAGEKEKQARLDVLGEEKRLSRERGNIARQEILDAIKNIQVKRDLELTALEAKARALEDYGTREEQAEANRQVRAATRAAEIQDGLLMAVYDTAAKRIKSEENVRNAVIAVDEETVRALNANRDALTDRQIAASAYMVAEIKKNYDELRIAGKTILSGVVEAFAAGLGKMATGAANFKDFLKGIWSSILNSVSSVIQQMVTKWILGWGVIQKLMGTGVPSGGVGQNLASTGTNTLLKSAGLLGGRAMVASTGAPGVAGGAGTLFGGGVGMGSGSIGLGSGTAVSTTTTGPLLAHMTQLQAGLLSAGAGYVAAGIADKVFKKWIDGSSIKGTTVGAIAGAGGGAAAGATIGALGGPIGAGAGALIGLGVGAIKGWWDARKMRKEMEADRKDILEQLGGLDEFKKKAEAAGFAYEKFLNTKKPSEFGKEVVAMKAAFDALDLKNAREELVKSAGGLEKLSKAMQLVGFDEIRLFGTKDIKEYNSEVERLNKMLEEQQKRLQGLGVAAQGLNTKVKAFADTLSKDLSRQFGDKFEEDLTKAFADAQKHGFTGTMKDFTHDPKAMDSLDLKKGEAEKLAKTIDEAQKGFSRLGLVATTTFGAVLRETGDINQAFAAVGDSLDVLIELQGKWGLEGSAALQKLLGLRDVAKANEDLVASLSGTVAVLQGLGDAGRLTEDVFNAMGDDVAAVYDKLIERGVDANDALLLSQPTLQALWEAQKKYGFATDEATQKMIDLGVEQGIVGANMQSVNDKMLDVLLLIAKALGADIPGAYKKMQDASKTSGTQAGANLDPAIRAAGDLDGRIRTATQRYKEMEDAARAAGQAGEQAGTDAAEGHSPSGIKQIVFRLKEAHALFTDLRDTFVSGAGQMERSAGFGKVLQFTPPSAQREKSGSQTVVVNHTSAVTLTVNGTKLSPREEWEALRPVLDRAVEFNEGQLSAKIAKAVARHQRAS